MPSSRQAKSYSKTSKAHSKNSEGAAMKQPQMALMGTPSMPALNYQAHLLGSQTISRSSNLHKQFYAQAQAAANRCSIYQQPVPPTGYLYYDQPTSGYQVPQGHLYGPPGQAHTLHRYSYAPMSLALRAPRDRGSIPMPMMQQAVYQQPLQHNGSTKQAANSEEPKKTPLASKMIYQEPTVNLMRTLEQQARLNKPLCRCRVMYLGSSVPHITKNGLHGIQEPLRHLYPEEQFNSASLRQSQKMAPPASGDSNSSNPTLSQTIDISHLSSSLGIDSWLSVWSNGLLLENVDEFGRDVRRFYSIESLHYCAAVRFFDTTTLMQATNQQTTSAASLGSQMHETDANNNQQAGSAKQQEASMAGQLAASRRGVVRFLPLDAPIFQYPGMLDASHPPVFAAIMRRTTGIKVLECHAFICRRDAASNALVRCCTHAYSDFLSAKRLSADFGFLQQQQASAYLGHTTTTTTTTNNGNGLPMTLDDELLARGQTLPSRRLRSTTSAGRHGKGSRAPLDGGQYQVIEALMSQTHQQDASSSSHKSGAQKRRAGRHPGANSTGTNSNELTHSDSVNSADESEPEDNYAIIPKSSSTLDNSATASRKVASTQQRPGRDRSSRRRSRKIKGSSKSLFKNFMPPPLEPHRQSAHELDIEKLSHSLDYLAMLSSQAPVANSSDRSRMSAHKSDYDEPAHTFGAHSDIMYSIVSSKSKRHSKSMQNLIQQQVQQPVAGSMDQKQASQRTKNRPPGGDRKGSLSRAHRRSASLQDILSLQQQARLDAPPVPPSPSSFASLSRRSSLRSSIASRSRRSRHSISNSHTNQNGSQHQHQHEHGGQRKSSSYVSSTEGNNARVYAFCDNSHQEREQPRILRPDCCTTKGSSRSQSRSGSSKRSRSKRREHHDHEPPPLEQAHSSSIGYHQPVPVHLQSLYNPLLGSPPPPAPQQAVYLPPAAYYAQPGSAPLYSSNSIYDTVTPPPAPFMPLPYVHSQYHHPQQQQQLFFPPPPALGQPHHLQPAGDYSMPAVETATGTSTKGKSKSKSRSKSATLATRFRCLSPPLNFFSSQADTQPQQLLDNSQSTQNVQDERQLVEHAPGQRESLVSLEECSDEQRRAISARGEIVSAQPGFMSNQAGEAGATTAAAATTTTTAPQASSVGRKQKLSWIKRLSITLSAGGSASQASGRALSAAGQLGRRESQASGFDEAPVRPAPQAETESAAQLCSVPENSRPDELNSDGNAGPDGQSLPGQLQWPQQPDESGGHQMDGFQAEEQTQEERASEREPLGGEKKAKRKRAGLFSGALTLGRSSGQKRGQAGKIVT